MQKYEINGEIIKLPVPQIVIKGLKLKINYSRLENFIPYLSSF
jgi:hypothetical protein